MKNVVQMPDPPAWLDPGKRAAAADVIGSEAVLETAGWRDLVTRLNSAEPGEYVRAVREFGDKLEAEREDSRRAGWLVGRRDGMALGALVIAVPAFVALVIASAFGLL